MNTEQCIAALFAAIGTSGSMARIMAASERMVRQTEPADMSEQVPDQTIRNLANMVVQYILAPQEDLDDSVVLVPGIDEVSRGHIAAHNAARLWSSEMLLSYRDDRKDFSSPDALEEHLLALLYHYRSALIDNAFFQRSAVINFAYQFSVGSARSGTPRGDGSLDPVLVSIEEASHAGRVHDTAFAFTDAVSKAADALAVILRGAVALAWASSGGAQNLAGRDLNALFLGQVKDALAASRIGPRTAAALAPTAATGAEAGKAVAEAAVSEGNLVALFKTIGGDGSMTGVLAACERMVRRALPILLRARPSDQATRALAHAVVRSIVAPRDEIKNTLVFIPGANAGSGDRVGAEEASWFLSSRILTYYSDAPPSPANPSVAQEHLLALLYRYRSAQLEDIFFHRRAVVGFLDRWATSSPGGSQIPLALDTMLASLEGPELNRTHLCRPLGAVPAKLGLRAALALAWWSGGHGAGGEAELEAFDKLFLKLAADAVVDFKNEMSREIAPGRVEDDF